MTERTSGSRDHATSSAFFVRAIGGQTPWRRALLIITGALVAAHAVFLIGMIRGDAGVFMTIGAGILDGRLPYVDYVDHKPPGIYYLLAGLFALARSALLAKVAIFVTNLLTAAGVYWLGTRLLGKRPGLVAVVLFLAGSLIYEGPNVYTEQFVALFGVLGTVGFWLSYRTGRSGYVLATGLCVGMATLFKQPGLAFLGAFGLLLVAVGDRDVSDIAYEATLLALGTAVPLGVATAYFWTQGALSQFLYWSLLVHIVGDSYAASPLQILGGNFLTVVRFPVLWSLALVGVLLAARNRSEREARVLLILVGFSMLPLLIRGWGHYYLQPLPFVALVAAYGVREAVEALGQVAGRTEIRVLLVALLLVPSGPYVQTVGTTAAQEVVQHNVFDDQRLGAMVAAQTNPDEPVLTLGEQAKFYFLADREPMNRHLYYLGINDYLYSDDALVRELERKQVGYVVIGRPCAPQIERVCDHVASTYRSERVEKPLHFYRLPASE